MLPSPLGRSSSHSASGYVKPSIRTLVVTDRPLCLTDRQFITKLNSKEGASYKDGGQALNLNPTTEPAEATNAMYFQSCPCPCITPCPCPCIGPCPCVTPSNVTSIKEGHPLVRSLDQEIYKTTFELPDNFKFRSESFGGLIFDKHTWRIYRINTSATLIVSLLDGKHTSYKLANVLSEHYAVPTKYLLDDVHQFLSELMAIGGAVA